MVARQPGLSRLFEQVGIDYCCGGKIPLDQACRQKGLDPQQLLIQLEITATAAGPADVDVAAMSLTGLADHIETTHHIDRKSTRLNSSH